MVNKKKKNSNGEIFKKKVMGRYPYSDQRTYKVFSQEKGDGFLFYPPSVPGLKLYSRERLIMGRLESEIIYP